MEDGSMKESLLNIIDELKRLKRRNVSHVYVSEDTLAHLHAVVGEQKPRIPEKTKPSVPVQERKKPAVSGSDSGILEDFLKSSGGKQATVPNQRTVERKASAAKVKQGGFMDHVSDRKEEVKPANHLELVSGSVDAEIGSTNLNEAMPLSASIKIEGKTKEERMHFLREKVMSCVVCQQNTPPGKKIVFGTGSLDADIFFCGEAPGADEEIQGFPFVGPAGQLLTKMIAAMGIMRESVYIGNIMNYRPKTETGFGNRPPTTEEMRYCLPYLIGQVKIIKPKVIVALGKTAAVGLLGLDPGIRLGDYRGRWHDFEGIPLRVTYHPSYLLQHASMKSKRDAWEDLLEVMRFLEMPVSEKQQNYFRK